MGIKLISIAKAIPGQTAEEFEERWLKGHVPLVAAWKNLKYYKINIPNQEIHKKLGEGIAFDGSAELYWNSYEEMIEDQSSEEGKAAYADADKYLGARLNLDCNEHVGKD
jgi:uncharacterized protein (TIGR02118 family)